jgi:hypothetical protein
MSFMWRRCGLCCGWEHTTCFHWPERSFSGGVDSLDEAELAAAGRRREPDPEIKPYSGDFNGRLYSTRVGKL